MTDLSHLPTYIATPADARRLLRSIKLRDVPMLRITGKANTVSAQLHEIAARSVGLIPSWNSQW